MPILLAQPDGQRLGDILKERLRDPQWTEFRVAVAFVKRSGVKHIADDLRAFAERGTVEIAVGVSMGGTSVEGLSALLECVEGRRGAIWVFHNENGSTFHPKLYLFTREDRAEVIIGSGNLTEGGLFDNYEASVLVSLRAGNEEDDRFLDQIRGVFATYFNADVGTSVRLTRETLEELTARGYLPVEAYARRTEEGAPAPAPADEGEGEAEQRSLFRSVPVAAPPRVRAADAVGRGAMATGPVEEVVREEAPRPATAARGVSVLYMTLQQTDVGTGQATAGAARRSPEIFIPLAARDFAPGFWNWPDGFVEDGARPGKRDRTGVLMLIGTTTSPVNMMTWPAKHDFRLRSEPLRSAASVGDILRIEKTDGSRGYEYIVTIIPQGSAQYATALAKCVNPVRNSNKQWGYE